MWILSLRDIRDSTIRPMAWADSKEQLEQYLKDERSIVDYQDGGCVKAFKMGSGIEFCYPPMDNGMISVGVPAIENVGTVDEWVQDTILNFSSTQEALYAVPTLPDQPD